MPEVSALVTPLCVLDPSPLCGLRGLCLSGRGMKAISASTAETRRNADFARETLSAPVEPHLAFKVAS